VNFYNLLAVYFCRFRGFVPRAIRHFLLCWKSLSLFSCKYYCNLRNNVLYWVQCKFVYNLGWSFVASSFRLVFINSLYASNSSPFSAWQEQTNHQEVTCILEFQKFCPSKATVIYRLALLKPSSLPYYTNELLWPYWEKSICLDVDFEIV